MTTFGTSAYLKLLALNPQPRDTEIRNRIWSTRGNPYDFHKAMRRTATAFAAGIDDWPSTRAKLKSIRKPAERISATAAVFALKRWVNDRPIRLLRGNERKIASPNEIFSVKFSPDFEIDLDGVLTQVHIWNTKKPTLRLREAIGMLGLFCASETPSSIAVVSLRTSELFLPTNYESARDLARILAIDVERRFTRIAEERRERRPRPPEERRAGR
ncbi:MAG: hypothetical protein JJ911_05530 [Rhizobiaceae bacterium]|nr:hypothetical protein [Rhizobiaceae bacterium]